MDAGPDRGRSGTDESTKRGRARGRRLPLRLRTVALVLLVGGFGGSLASDTAPVTPYSYAFLAGVACATAAVFLGLHRAGE